MNLAEYQLKLSSLSVDRSSGHPKPHKVCLLFAVMELIEKGKITDNKIYLNDELKAAFTQHFEKLKKGNDANQIYNPFFHLLKDGFWHFHTKPGCEGFVETFKAKKQTPGEKAIIDNVEFAYLDKELFEFFSSGQTRPVLKEALLENLEDLSVQFHRWLVGIGKSASTADKYVSAVKGSISNWASEGNISRRNLISMQSYSQLCNVAEQIKHYHTFIDRNTKGNNMYSCALEAYKEFLADTCQVQVSEDISDIITSTTIPETEKAMLVSTRIGQGKFREKLIQYWKGCAATGYPATQFLVASHIKPWRASNNEERLSVYNGLLLLPNLDKAFDLGYITFEETGKVKISEALEEHNKLGILPNMKIPLVKEHQDFIAYHREVVFKH